MKVIKRNGEEVELPKREVEIKDIELLGDIEYKNNKYQVKQINFRSTFYNDFEELYKICEKIRFIVDKHDYKIGRIIARPFTTTADGNFKRTEDRKDYALCPPEESALDHFKNAGYDVVGVGKIEDIFQWQGLTESYHTKNNEQGLEKTLELSKSDKNGIIFIL